MHILLLPSWYPSHPNDINGCFIREQAVSLSEAGCQVGVIYPALRSFENWKSIFSGNYGFSFERDQKINTLRWHGMNWFPLIPAAKSWIHKRYGMRLFNQYVLQFGAPEIIHVHSMVKAGSLAQALHDRYGIPLVITEHSTAFARGRISAHQKAIIKQLTHSAKRLFAVSEPFSALLTKSIDSKKKWRVMPNFVNDKFFLRALERQHNEDAFTFLSIALLTRKKGVDTLLRAFAKAFKDQNNVVLRIGGEGPLRKKLVQLSERLGIRGQVEFLGLLHREQVVDQMAFCDAFALASRHETFGIVVAEALALGKPVIATKCGGPEYIVDENQGIIVPSNDVDSMAEAMTAIYSNRPFYNGSSIRSTCAKRFSEQAVTSKLIYEYHSVLKDELQLARNNH